MGTAPNSVQLLHPDLRRVCFRRSVGLPGHAVGLVPRVDLIERAHLPRGDAHRGEPGEPVGGAALAQSVLQRDGQLGAVLDTTPGGGETGVGDVDARGDRDRTPLDVVADGDLDDPSSVANAPYGAMVGWWLPMGWGTSPATVHRVNTRRPRVQRRTNAGTGQNGVVVRHCVRPYRQ